MVEARQNLPLVTEATRNHAGARISAYDFDRHLLLELVIGANGPIDRPHPALADLFKELVRAGSPPDQTRLIAQK